MTTPFGAPEYAYDSSMDNYLTECACCGEPEYRDDLDHHCWCDACINESKAGSYSLPGYTHPRLDSAVERRERVGEDAYNESKEI